jgi:hypothetical protein
MLEGEWWGDVATSGAATTLDAAPDGQKEVFQSQRGADEELWQDGVNILYVLCLGV